MLVRTTHSIQREFEAQLSKLDMPYLITGPRLRVLSVVSESCNIRMSELAAKLGIKARSVTDFVFDLLLRLAENKDISNPCEEALK